MLFRGAVRGDSADGFEALVQAWRFARLTAGAGAVVGVLVTAMSFCEIDGRVPGSMQFGFLCTSYNIFGMLIIVARVLLFGVYGGVFFMLFFPKVRRRTRVEHCLGLLLKPARVLCARLVGVVVLVVCFYVFQVSHKAWSRGCWCMGVSPRLPEASHLFEPRGGVKG